MGEYLIVADQTASSPELLDSVRALMAEDSSAEFVLLVPATHDQHLLTWAEGETRLLARERAEFARSCFLAAGVPLIDARVGDASPLVAIEEALREHSPFDAIVISTFPLGVSRWLRVDLPGRLRRRFGLRVIHVVSQRVPTAAAGSSA